MSEENVKLTRVEKLQQKIDMIEARLVRDQASKVELEQELADVTRLNSVAAGVSVIVRIGRGETAREVQGLIVGVKSEEDSATRYKVQYGEGFEADIAVVFGTQIVRVL